VLNSQNAGSLHTFDVSLDQARNTTALTVQLTNNRLNEVPQAKLRKWESVLDIEASFSPVDDIEGNAASLAKQISGVFNDEGAFLSSLLQNSPFESPRHQLQSLEQQAKLDGRNTRAFKYASTYHLTFSLVTPHGSPSAWDIEAALSESIAKLIEPLSAISHFVVNSQVQLFARFSPSISGPTFDSVNNRWILQHDDLSGFVNAAEWPLSPSIGSGPTINFILYVPGPEQSPLHIGDSGQTSWIVPQWGGVQIHNMANNATQLTAADLEEDMLIFAEQLTTLLGVPQTPPSLSLRIASLTRERATSLILSASSTLGALARLTLKLTSIAIPDSVAKSVDATIHHLEQACQNLNAGRYQDALANARIAEAEVEKAFFEPSMVGQVYFPEEHKVAVYVPLLGPMAVPLIMAGLKEIRRLRERKVKTN
jgi:phosphatidylinositol glycan class S